MAPIGQHGSALLAGLIGFIHPIVSAACRPPSESQRANLDPGMGVANLCHSNEGRVLLEALRKFVGLMIDSQINELSTEQKGVEEGINRGGSDNDILATASHAESEVDASSTSMQMTIPKLPTQELPSTISDKVYEHVFNYMPIRILAFQSHGTQPELLERSAVASLIISRIHNAYPNGLDGKDEPELVKEFSKYAILSHTWIRGTPGEVLYQDWEARGLPIHSLGHSKISRFCEVAARQYGVSLGWMDTVCINKNSSSELDESIRSMYKWYQSAHVCVTFLAETFGIEDMHLDPWFTRGWTLQELLAPRNTRFYNRYWQPLVPDHPTDTSSLDYWQAFNRDFETSRKYLNRWRDLSPDIPVELQYEIFRATSITRVELYKFALPGRRVSLSRIMQLAARRKVTRDEDSIYSLMGLLGVGIPIAYGEGSQYALRRIIREIMGSGHVLDFMDLFHHHNGHSIIPARITDYMERSSVFDRFSSNTLNYLRQPEPVMLTHMGVRLKLVAVPAFRKDIYEHQIPSQCRSHSFSISKMASTTDSEDYIVLDDSDYSASWATKLDLYNDHIRHITGHPILLFMAVLGSVVDSTDDAYWLVVQAGNAVCIALTPAYTTSVNTGSRILADLRPGRQFSGPMEIRIPYPSPSDSDGIVRIPQTKGDGLGLKSLTKYFR